MSEAGEQHTSFIWRPAVEPTQSPVPYPDSFARTSQGALASSTTNARRYTKTSLAHRYDNTQDVAGHSTTHDQSTLTGAAAAGAQSKQSSQQLNRRILNASQSYNSSPRPFVRQQASLSDNPSKRPSSGGGGGGEPSLAHRQAFESCLGSLSSSLSLASARAQPPSKQPPATMSPKLVHQQYNSPMNLYSMNNICKTIEAHSELLAPGVKGINFMKADAPVNKQSEVLKLIREQEQEQGQGQAAAGTASQQQSQRRVQYAAEQSLCNHRSADEGALAKSILRQPVARAVSLERHLPAAGPASNAPLASASGAPKCFECGQQIIGPFARLADRCIHPQCFNCSTCGSSLKNSGYFTINDKLYCEIHARQVANVMRLNYNFEPNKQAVISDNQQQQHASEHARREVHSQHFQSVKQQADVGGGGVQVAPGPQQPPPLPPPTLTVSGAHCSHCCQASNRTVGHQHQATGVGATTISTMFSGAHGQHCEHCNNACSCQRRSEIRWTWRPASHADNQQQQQQQQLANSSHQQSFAASSSTTTAAMSTSRTIEQQHQRNKYESRLQAYATSGDRAMTGAGPAATAAAPKAPVCCHCRVQIYGPYILAGESTWCKPCSQTNFVCNSCHRSLLNVGFIEDSQTGQLNCEHCYETHLAPVCSRCNARIRGDCLNALGKRWHPNCFVCGHCRGPFGNSSFYLEDDVPYCERDWNLLFTTKCFSCGYPIEAGDKWIEALAKNYHSDCFRCTGCQVKLEGSTFYCKGGKPYCQMHAR